MVRNCVEEIKEIICDAEDITETFLLKEKLGKTSGVKNRIRRLACIIQERKVIALEIGGISKRISKVVRDMKSYGVQKIIVDGGSITQPLHDRQREMRHTFSRDYERDLVGLEASTKKLVGVMVDENNVQVVSITGMGGLGKTTLARQVFNHEKVKNKFEVLAWVCVSQDFTRKSVWQTILQSFRPKEDEDKILKMTEPTLQDELFRLLETSKSLIVLDDVWKEEAWDLIKPIFPPKKGWKVLLTSRNESVAVHGDVTHIHFKPECLTIEDSWTLFHRIAFPRKDTSELKVDEEMEEMGKQMIKHCGGLPLAIRVLGGLLAAKYSVQDWKRVFEDIGSHIVGGTNFNDGNNSSIYYVLSLSFEELPSYLQLCFLYLAHFPEDYAINIEKLSYYWAAEGIPKPRYYDGGTIRDVGDGYIEELVSRNMVIAKRDIKTLRFETCQLHDMMREICLFKAKEENFLQIDSICSSTTNSQSPGTSRRFVSQYPTTFHVERDIKHPKLRSLLIVCDELREHWMLSSSSFTRLELLRVLDISGARFKGWKLPSGIGKLIHLRYLSLERVWVRHLPSSLQKLKLLIYLNIDIYGGTIFVPNVFMGMQELRYLALPDHMDGNTKLDLSNLVNLETLKNFPGDRSSFKGLNGMVRLKTLKINNLGYRGTNNKILSSTIGGLRYLENLTIDNMMLIHTSPEEFVLDSVHLKHLKLTIYMPRLPEEQHFPSHLTTISLSGCHLVEDPMPILEKLLHLNKVCLRRNSFCGRRMVCSSGGFPQLHKIELFGLPELEEWIVEEGSMSLLRTMSITYCEKLKELPDGIRFITSLKDLYARSNGSGWEEGLSEGGEAYYKVQHIPSVIVKEDDSH